MVLHYWDGWQALGFEDKKLESVEWEEEDGSQSDDDEDDEDDDAGISR